MTRKKPTSTRTGKSFTPTPTIPSIKAERAFDRFAELAVDILLGPATLAKRIDGVEKGPQIKIEEG